VQSETGLALRFFIYYGVAVTFPPQEKSAPYNSPEESPDAAAPATNSR
jgi:hypothetical protein